MHTLFSPFQLRGTLFKNRIVVSPMCQYTAHDGFANNWHLVHLGARAIGGAALVMQEATAISPEGRISYGDLGIWKDEQIAMYNQITSFIHSQGSLAGIQLAHAGRKASTEIFWKGGKQFSPDEPNGWQTVSSGNIPYHESDLPPVPLLLDGIKKVITDFTSAAERAEKAGYDVLEIHAAHGYLINQFTSPLCNNRTDEFGGSFDNRIRILLEICNSVRTVWPPHKPLFVRISAVDWKEGGWQLEDSVRLAKILKDNGVDLIDCSSGAVVPHVKIEVKPGYQVPFASRIRHEAKIPVAAVGLITGAFQAEQILKNGDADLIMIARESLRDPNFPLRAANELGEEIRWPRPYERGKFMKKTD